MQQNKQAPNPDQVKWVNGVWVIVDKSTSKSYGWHYGPFDTKKAADAAFAGGK